MKRGMQLNIFLYRILKVMGELAFIGPIWMRFLQDELCLGYTFIFWLEIGCMAFAILLSFFTGPVIDLVGRRPALIIGLVCLIAGIAIFALAQDWVHIMISDMLCMSGFVFIGPAEKALLRDSLDRLGRGGDFRSELGIANRYYYLFMTILTLSSGFILKVASYRFLFWIQTVWLSLALVSVLFIKEPNGYVKRKRQAKNWRDLVPQFREGFRLFWKQWRDVKASFGQNKAAQALLFLSAGVLLPVSHMFYTPYFYCCQMSKEAFCWAFVAFNLVCLLSMFLVPWLEKHCRDATVFALMLVARVLSWLLMAMFAPLWGFVFIFGEQFCRALWDPMTTSFLYQYFPEKQRGSASTVNGMIMSGMKILVLLAVGPLLEADFPIAYVLGFLWLIPALLGGFGILKIRKLEKC